MSVIVKMRNCIGPLRILSYNFTILIIDRRLIYDRSLITVVEYREKFIPIIADDNLRYIETRVCVYAGFALCSSHRKHVQTL